MTISPAEKARVELTRVHVRALSKLFEIPDRPPAYTIEEFEGSNATVATSAGSVKIACQLAPESRLSKRIPPGARICAGSAGSIATRLTSAAAGPLVVQRLTPARALPDRRRIARIRPQGNRLGMWSMSFTVHEGCADCRFARTDDNSRPSNQNRKSEDAGAKAQVSVGHGRRPSQANSSRAPPRGTPPSGLA